MHLNNLFNKELWKELKGLKRLWKGLTMIFAIIVFMTGCSNEDTSEDIFNAYLANWQEMNFEAMYQSLSKEAKAEISQKEFVKRYENIYEGMETKKLQVDAKIDSNSKKSNKTKALLAMNIR